MYSGFRITFDGNGERNFGNDFAKNVIIFGVDNHSSSYTDNRKNDFLKVKVQLLVLIETLVHQKKLDIDFSKVKTKFCLSLHYKADNITYS